MIFSCQFSFCRLDATFKVDQGPKLISEFGLASLSGFAEILEPHIEALKLPESLFNL